MGAGLELLGRLGGVDDLPVAVDGAVAVEALGALPDIPDLDGLEGAGALIQALAPVHLVHRLGLVLWQTSQDLEESSDQLAAAAAILERIRKDGSTSSSSKEKLKHFDLQTDCYALLQV